MPNIVQQKRQKLALEGGTPVRANLLPYSRQSIDAEDISGISEVLRSDWLTTGPMVPAFEQAFATFTNAEHAVAVSNGTAALHAAMHAAGIKEGDEVIVPAMTFAATANAVLYCGGTPVFVDSDPDSLLIDPEKVHAALSKKTKAIVAVDYAGHPCDYDTLRAISDRHKITLIADGCHAVGGSYKGRPVGSLADMTCFSFHPVKPMTTGEGGMITTGNKQFAERMKKFRNHGITSDHRQRHEEGSWFYAMEELGFNYRLTDFQSALGMTQLTHVPEWTKRRQEIAKRYDAAFVSIAQIKPLTVLTDISHAYHLYVILLQSNACTADREKFFKALRMENIGVNVHYIPVHTHPYYTKRFGVREGLCPVAEAAYKQIISIPIFSGMSDQDAEDVIEATKKVCQAYAR